jgi:5-formyltetrahydrofolate cyclo-ligase
MNEREIEGAKAQARATGLAARRALGSDARATASAAIAERALALPEVASARSVLAYAALADEADPGALVRALRARGARIALPRVCGPSELALHWTPDGTELVEASFGIAEPPADCETALPTDLDLVLVPGVAFDRSCGRLGFGRGFYDALLASLPPGVTTVGIAFDEQVCERVPVRGHDVALDYVITPSRAYRRAR